MNKISLAINAVLAVAVGVLFYFHFAGKKNTTSTDADLAASRDSVSRNVTMVYVNVDSLWANYKYVEEITNTLEGKKNSMLAELSSKTSNLENKLDAKAQAFQKKVQDFESKAEGMNQTLQQIRMQALQEENAELEQQHLEAQQQVMRLKEEMAAQLMQEEAKLNVEVEKIITAYLKKYNEEHNYTYILSKGTGGGVMLAHPALDITDEVVSGLNTEYEEKKKAEKK